MIEYINIPVICPCCGGSVEIETSPEGVRNLVCNNPQCEGKLINIVDHFVGKKGLDVKGLSKATIEKLINWGWLNSRLDVFKLSEYAKEWQNAAGFGTQVKVILEQNEKLTIKVDDNGKGISDEEKEKIN